MLVHKTHDRGKVPSRQVGRLIPTSYRKHKILNRILSPTLMQFIRRKIRALRRGHSYLWTIARRLLMYFILYYFGYYRCSLKSYTHDTFKAATVTSINTPLRCPPVRTGECTCPTASDLQFPPLQQWRQSHTCNFQQIPFVHSELASAKILFHSNTSCLRCYNPYMIA